MAVTALYEPKTGRDCLIFDLPKKLDGSVAVPRNSAEIPEEGRELQQHSVEKPARHVPCKRAWHM